jgi:Zn ribbon nucleic-acid-binding protein
VRDLELMLKSVLERMFTCVKILHEDEERDREVKQVLRKITQSVNYYTETRRKTKEIMKMRF